MNVIRISAPDTEFDDATAVRYDGSLELGLLYRNETVCSAGDGPGACEVTTPTGTLRFDIGNWIVRTHDGRLARTDYDLATLNPVPVD